MEPTQHQHLINLGLSEKEMKDIHSLHILFPNQPLTFLKDMYQLNENDIMEPIPHQHQHLKSSNGVKKS